MEPSKINCWFMKFCFERYFGQFPIHCISAVGSPAVVFHPTALLALESVAGAHLVVLFLGKVGAE
jgi:hypothetical protein